MSLSGFQGLSYLICRRGARRGGLSICQPILGVEHQRLPHFPAPELANMNTRDLAVLRLPIASPTILNRRQFHAPGSPNQQLLSPRMRQSAQRRLPYQYPLPPSLPSTPVLSFPATPPPSPTHDLELYRNRFNSTVCNAVTCPSSPFNSEFTARLLAGPPRSPLARTSQPAPESADMAQARLQHLTHMEPVLPVRLPSPGPAEATFPQLQTIPCDDSPQSIAFPDTSASPLLPSPILADRGPVAFLSTSSQPQRCVVRRCPSFPLPATPPSPVPESGVAASEARKPSTTKMIKRHSMVFRTFRLPRAPLLRRLSFRTWDHRLCRLLRDRPSKGRHRIQRDVPNLLRMVELLKVKELRSASHWLIKVPLNFRSLKLLNYVLHPANILRLLFLHLKFQDASNIQFITTTRRRLQSPLRRLLFGQKGWAATGPNELAPPPAKKAKKKKKKGITRGSGFSQPSSPIPSLLPAFGQSGHAGSPLLKSEMSRFDFDSTALETTSVEQIVTTGCHPNCADIYCPGGCSEDKCD
ncbi:hypothetical protein B0H13DRAFT_2139929 [Mycena leptocephala]|nr:hypothetical protein B0H13DRAFT_2139929 [Mycena leptocephala]